MVIVCHYTDLIPPQSPSHSIHGLSTTFQSPGDQQDSHVLGSDKCSVSNFEILSEENVNVRVLSFHPRHMQGVWDVLGQRCTSADAFVMVQS